MRFLSRTLFALFVLALANVFVPACLAQLPVSNSPTMTPIPGAGHDYLNGPAETVNPANGSVSIRIPVIVPPGRGITLPFSFAYDSGGVNFVSRRQQVISNLQWFTTGADNGNTNSLSQAGWSPSIPMIGSQLIMWTTKDDSGHTIPCTADAGFVYQDAQGGRHNLGLTYYQDTGGTSFCTINTQDWPLGFNARTVTQGGEGSLLATLSDSGAVTVTDADGTVFLSYPSNQLWPVPSITDRYGNSIIIGGTFPAFNYVDTAGRTVLQDSGFAVSPETLTVSGLGAPYTANWTTLATPTFSTPTVALPGSNWCSTSSNGVPHYPWGSSQNHAVSSITLANGKSFTFTYDSVYGLVNKMTYPTGGYVRYVYGMNAQADFAHSHTTNGQTLYDCFMYYGVPAVFDRYVSFDGVNEVLHQHFVYSTTWDTTNNMVWDSKQTIVTAYDLVRNTSFETIYTYRPINDVCQPNMPCGPPPEIPVESSIAYYNDLGTTLLKTVSKTWQNQRLLKTEETVYPNGQTNETAWNYNTSEMQIEQDDYDFGNNAPGNFLRAAVTSYATFGTNHIVDKPSSVIAYSDSAKTNKVAETDYTYDSPAGTTTSGIVHHSGGCNCGSLTTSSQWLNSSGSTLSTTYTNDDTGQRLSTTDPRGDTTTYSYADSYSSGTPPGPTNAYLTQITHPQTGGVNHIEHFAYAYASGEVTSSTDQNNLVTSYKYLDNLARLTETDFPDGSVTTVVYNDSAYNPSTPSPSVTTTKKINTSTNLVTVSAMDGLGHPVTSLVTSDPQGTIHTDTTYDGMARVYTVSNPYRTGTDPTTSSGTTTYVYDSIGRKLTETYPDNSVLTTAYCGPSTLVTDPTGKWRRSRTDGLGRLVEVDEPNAPGVSVNSNGCPGTGEPIWVTSYALDTLGNLKTVLQNGSHQRNFSYDWTSRLLTSNNPEVGTITYNYDSDSNCASPNSFAGLLVSKVDARGIHTCAQYDALNRETVVNYSNGDPTITTTYDQSACLGLSACQNIGHRTTMTDAAGSELWAFQVDNSNLRSVHKHQRTTSNITKTTTFVLDLAGNTTQATYPTGRVVNFTFDAANRPKTAADGSNGITYATDFQTAPTGCLAGAVCYTPQGTFYALSIGQSSSFTGLNLTHTYNSRLQPNEFKASSTGGNAIDITYGFVDPVSSKNAGHVYAITNNLNTNRSQQFSYDQLNRITYGGTTVTSSSTCWGYNFTYDAWANLLSQTGDNAHSGCSEPVMAPVTADGNNHLSVFSYDASGNTTNDGTYTYPWNAESQLKSSAGITYAYDGDGRRVSKTNGSAWRLYWYGSGGEVLAETDGAGNTQNEYIFFGGQRIADLPAGSTALYYVEDMLGTSRVLTTNTGSVCYDADFSPYGGEGAWTSTCLQNYRFEGKERDAETGNDDFGARYYTYRFGRWLSADWSSVPVPVPYANLTNPQTLNLYSMVADDPESFADLDGHCCDVWDAINFVLGAANAYGSDNLAGAGRQSQSTFEGKVGAAIGDTIAAAQSVVEVVAGGAGEVGGTGLILTGAGAPAGVFVDVGSTALIVHGGATGTVAAANLGAAAGNAITAVIESRSSGPKAADAPGVSAGGQATDKQGNKLGPSRKPQVNETNSNTREGAGNRALNEGSGKVEHPNPKRGEPHFHPTDNKGKKKPGSTHHNYPD
jgi:RHS repeat-associated protein